MENQRCRFISNITQGWPTSEKRSVGSWFLLVDGAPVFPTSHGISLISAEDHRRKADAAAVCTRQVNGKLVERTESEQRIIATVPAEGQTCFDIERAIPGKWCFQCCYLRLVRRI